MTSHINGCHNDRSVPCLYTVTGWCAMSCVCGMAFLFGSTLVKIPLLQAGTVVIWPQLFTSDVKPQQTDTWGSWAVAIKDDLGMLGRTLAKVEPQPTTREKQSEGNPKTFPLDEENVARMHHQTRWSSTLLISFLSFFNTLQLVWTNLWIWWWWTWCWIFFAFL